MTAKRAKIALISWADISEEKAHNYEAWAEEERERAPKKAEVLLKKAELYYRYAKTYRERAEQEAI